MQTSTLLPPERYRYELVKSTVLILMCSRVHINRPSRGCQFWMGNDLIFKLQWHLMWENPSCMATNGIFSWWFLLLLLLSESLFSNDEDDDEEDLLESTLGPHHHHPSLSPGSTSLSGLGTPTKTIVSSGVPQDTDVRTPVTSSGDNSNPEKDNGNESEVSTVNRYEWDGSLFAIMYNSQAKIHSERAGAVMKGYWWRHELVHPKFQLKQKQYLGNRTCMMTG